MAIAYDNHLNKIYAQPLSMEYLTHINKIHRLPMLEAHRIHLDSMLGCHHKQYVKSMQRLYFGFLAETRIKPIYAFTMGCQNQTHTTTI